MVDYYIFDHGPSKQNLTISNNSFVWIRGHLREREIILLERKYKKMKANGEKKSAKVESKVDELDKVGWILFLK
jgi:hypothetical protein